MLALLLNGLAFGVLLLVLSSGLAMIFGLRDVVNFAHGAVYMLAAFIGFSITQYVNFWLALILTPLIFAGLGVLFDRLVIRPLEGRDHLDMLLITFGMTYVLTGLVQMIWGTQPRTVPAPDPLGGSVNILGTAYPTYRLFLIVLGLAVAAALLIWLRKSTVGLYVRASTDHRDVATVLGVHVDRVSVIVVSLGTALAGLAGVLAGPYLSLSTNMGVEILVLTFIVVVTGGLGSIGGAMIAAILLGMLNSFSANFLPSFAPFVPYALMLAVLLLRPTGIAGTRAV